MSDSSNDDLKNGESRRTAMTTLTTLGMFGALTAAYGTLAGYMARFLYPAKPAPRGWMFVAEVARFAAGDALVYRLPSGATVNVACRGEGGTVDDFIALSSVCPHLGCQVHWEGQNSRFFCPCHNGVFDPEGVATGGPPADAGQTLPRFPLKAEGGLLFIEAGLEEASLGEGEVVDAPWREPGPGHDPCLAPRVCRLDHGSCSDSSRETREARV